MLIDTDSSRWLWDPAAPNSVSGETICDSALADLLFCAGHSVDKDGNIVTHGGNRKNWEAPCTLQPRFSYVLDTAALCWSPNRPLVVPDPNPAPTPANLGFWYPSSLRLPDGRIVSFGGGSAPLTNGTGQTNHCQDQGSLFFNDGWQIFDPALGWFAKTGPGAWFDGWPGNSLNGTTAAYDNNFNYYPLTVLLPATTATPAGSVFVAASTNNRVAWNFSTPVITPASSVSAWMDLGAAGWPNVTNPWAIRDQVQEPNGAPRNLYFPNGLLRPLELGMNGQLLPNVPVEFMVLAGSDNNVLPVFGTGGNSDQGGRPALAEVQQITSPDQGTATWSANGTRFPNLVHPRIYSNAVILPSGQLFVVGGSRFDFFPYGPDKPQNFQFDRRYERIADPVFEPEIMDLFEGQPSWAPCTPHVSPRLYHSVALVLQDGRVLVAGGYRGSRLSTFPANAQLNWSLFDPFATNPPVQHPHSDIEIYSPEYLFAGARPQIQSTTLGGAGFDIMQFGSVVQITVARPGSSEPAAEILSVCLLSCGAVTHHYDWDQRYVGLYFERVQSTTNKIVVTAPASGSTATSSTIAPPGWYMLFVTVPNDSGTARIPSIAKFVKLE